MSLRECMRAHLRVCTLVCLCVSGVYLRMGAHVKLRECKYRRICMSNLILCYMIQSLWDFS